MRNFTGREIECEKISSLMTSESTRFVNIWGSPGFGKTSTAIAVAHHLQSLGHPVYFFKYRGLRLKREFISKLRSIFNSVSTSIANANLTDADKLCSIFREIPCRFFLVLDNLDDLLTCNPDDIVATSVRDEVVDLIHEILDSCPNVCMLTTTREYLEFMRLRVAGYESLRIDPLDQLSANNLVRKFLPSASEYIRFQVTKISGNVPLAIALLSPLIVNEDTETAQQILVEVQSSENVQENFDNPYNTGNETLKKLFDSSFDRLLQNEKHALISLSVFLGTDIDSKAAVAVIGFDRVLACKRALSILVNKSFIDEDPESKMYNLHPLLQSFVIEKGKSEFNEVAFSAKIRFYNYYLCLFESLNELFLTGKSLTAAFTFFRERKNIYLSFYESLSHERLCDNVFHVLSQSELFLVTLYVNDHNSVESLYSFAIKKSEEQKNDLAYCKLVVSKCFQKTLYTGNEFSFLSEITQIRNKNASMHDGIEAKCLCYEGIHAVSNGMVKSGVELMEKGVSNLTKSFDQQILKCLTLQLLVLYYIFLKNIEKSEQFFQMAFDKCNEIGDQRLFVIGECRTNTETENKEEKINQPSILGHVCVLSIWAREFLSDEMKSRWCNIVFELQNQLEVAAQSSGNATSQLFQIGDLALVFLETDQTTHIDRTIQTIKNATETEKNSVSPAKTGEETLDKTERQKELKERLAQCCIRKASCHSIKEEKSLALESFQHALDVILELNGKQHPATAEIYSYIATAQHNMEDYSSAIESGRHALEINKKLHGEEHETTAENYSEIGKTQNNMKDFASALESLRRSLHIRLKLHGEQHPSTAKSYCNIGMAQNSMGDFALSLESFRRALDIRLNLHGEQHPSTAESYCNIGMAQNNMGDYTSALESYHRAHDIRLNLHGEQHPATADSYSEIARTQNNMGKLSASLKSNQHALEIRLKFRGENHSSTADSYYRMGIIQRNMGEYAVSRESLQRALDTRWKLYGEQHETTAESYFQIGITQFNMGDQISGLQSSQRALQIRLNLGVEQDSTTADIYEAIGNMQYTIGEYTSALESHVLALSIRLSLHGEIHESTANSYNAIGNVQKELGENTSALKSFHSALDVRVKLHGEAHSTTANCYYLIGVVQYNIRDYAAALLSQKRALDIMLTLGMEEHAEAAACYYLIGMTQTKIGDNESALETQRRGLVIRLKLHGEQHETTADSYFEMGTTQFNKGDYSSALKSLRCALDIRLRLHGEQHRKTAESYFLIGITQFRMGDDSSALQLSQRALQIRLNLVVEQDSTTADIYEAIGDMQHKIGEYTSALESHVLALSIRLSLHGEIHESTANSYNAIGNVQKELGENTSALKSFHSALDVRVKLHGDAHSTTANCYYSIGVVQYNIWDYAAALLSLYRALDIMLKLGMEEHAEAADCYYLIGMTHIKMGDNESALESHRRALDIRLKLHVEEHETTADSYFQMGTTQFNMGDYRSALDSHQHGVDIRLKLHEHHSTTVDSYIQIGITQNKLNDYAAALESISKALKLSWKLNGKLHATTADCYRYKAINLQKLGKRDLASEDFKRERFIRSKISK